MIFEVLLGVLLVTTSPTFDEVLHEARRALAKEKLGLAGAGCRSAIALSDEAKVGGPRAARAQALCAEVAKARGRPAKTVGLYREALFLIPDDPTMRARLLAKWRGAAQRLKRNRGRERAAAAALKTADRTVESFRRRPRRKAARLEKDLGRLDQAIEAIAAAGDRRRARYAKVVRQLVRVRSGQAEGALAGLGELPRSAHRGTQSLALLVASEAHLALAEPGPAADAALRRDLLLEKGRLKKKPGLDAEPADALLLRPSGVLRRACAQLDRLEGPGRCARRARAQSRRFLVTDGQTPQPVRARASALLEKLHAEATVFLEDCFLRAARADPARFQGAELSLSWTIDRSGAAVEPELRPSRYQDLIAGCVSERLGWLRYPALRGGAHQNVSLGFMLN